MNVIVIGGFGFSKQWLKDCFRKKKSLIKKISQKETNFFFFSCQEIFKYPKKNFLTKSPCIIIGWSLGALLALDIFHHKNIKGLFLMSIGLFLEDNFQQKKTTQKLIKKMIKKMKNGEQQIVLKDFYQNSFYPISNYFLMKNLESFLFHEKNQKNKKNDFQKNILIKQLEYIDTKLNQKINLPKNIPIILWQGGSDLIFPSRTKVKSNKNIYSRCFASHGHALPFYQKLDEKFCKDFNGLTKD